MLFNKCEFCSITVSEHWEPALFFTWEYETYHRQTQHKKLPVVKIKDDDVMAMFYTGSLIFAMFWGCLDMHAFFDPKNFIGH